MSLKPISHPSYCNCSYKHFLIETEESKRGLVLGTLDTLLLQSLQIAVDAFCALSLPYTCWKVIELPDGGKKSRNCSEFNCGTVVLVAYKKAERRTV